MTYRNKLLLKRALIGLAIAVGVIALLLLIGYTYLGRYVVYTQDGAYFSFSSTPPQASGTAGGQLAQAPSNAEVQMGSAISANEVLSSTASAMKDTEVRGVFVDYQTLVDGSTLNEIEVGTDESNTLMLEMRASNEPIVSNDAVTALIQRAKSQDTWVIAVLSCLSDSEYALAHDTEALKIDGGALWMSRDGSYWLDPAQPEVINRIADKIRQLAQMGFDEVVLNDFTIPLSDTLVYDYGDSTREDIMVKAYNNLVDATVDQCKLGLQIRDPSSGHPAMIAADRIYVCFESGAYVREYAQAHPDQYLVYITSSHDTRFDGYGKIECSAEYNEGVTYIGSGGSTETTQDTDDPSEPEEVYEEPEDVEEVPEEPDDEEQWDPVE